MKNIQNKDFSNIHSSMFLYVFLFAIGLWSSSCGDKCKDTLCENGYCIKGDCFCDDGYLGDNCEIMESKRFVGLYSGKLKFSDIPGSQNVDVKVKDKLYRPFDIEITINSHNGINAFNLRARINQDSIYVEESYNEHITQFDTIINLIYSSKGILRQDSIIELPINYRNINFAKAYTVQLNAIKQK